MNKISTAAQIGLSYGKLDGDFNPPKTQDELGVLQAIDAAIVENQAASKTWKWSTGQMWQNLGFGRGGVGPSLLRVGEASFWTVVGGLSAAKDGMDAAVLSAVRRNILKGAPLLERVTGPLPDLDAMAKALSSKS